MSNSQIVKAYSIKDVSKKINTPIGTIRQWEKDLTGVLVIPRSKKGSRYYTDKEIILLQKVKELRENNVSKNLIRTLLKKHLSEMSDFPVDSFEITDDSKKNTKSPIHETGIVKTSPPANNVEEFYTSLEAYKQELLTDIQNVMMKNREAVINEIKRELSSASLHTVKELSKSIQRSNDKRKAETLDISNTILQASEHTSESFAALSETVTNTSKGTFEQLSKRISEASKATARENKNTVNKVSKAMLEAKNDFKKAAHLLDEKQEQLQERMDEIKEYTEEIQHREEVFQGMLQSFREAAASKAKRKKWWQVWS